jgi:hypothetical protein
VKFFGRPGYLPAIPVSGCESARWFVTIAAAMEFAIPPPRENRLNVSVLMTPAENLGRT